MSEFAFAVGLVCQPVAFVVGAIRPSLQAEALPIAADPLAVVGAAVGEGHDRAFLGLVVGVFAGGFADLGVYDLEGFLGWDLDGLGLR